MTNFFRAVISIGISGKTTYINDPMIDLLNGLSGSEFVNQRKHDSNAVCGRSSKNLSRRYQLDTFEAPSDKLKHTNCFNREAWVIVSQF